MTAMEMDSFIHSLTDTKKNMFILLLLAFLLNQASLNQASATSPQSTSSSFNFETFDNTSCGTDSQLVCSGSVIARDGYLSLTQSTKQSEVGKVLFRYPLMEWPSYFTSTFEFKIKKVAGSRWNGDGMTFILASDNSPASIHKAGSYLGLMEKSKKARKDLRQIALAMDTYDDGGELDGNHMAVITNCVEKPLLLKSLNDFGGIQLTSGRHITVRVEYNRVTNWLRVSAAYQREPLVEFFSLNVDIPSIVENPIYVGFTAATGQLTESHEVHSWSFAASTTN